MTRELLGKDFGKARGMKMTRESWALLIGEVEAPIRCRLSLSLRL